MPDHVIIPAFHVTFPLSAHKKRTIDLSSTALFLSDYNNQRKYFVFRMDIHKECALQLFMTKDEKGYWLYEPKQRAVLNAVTFERNYNLEEEYVLVMDIHSHGTLPTFFSDIDNQDEKGIRLYMVVGDFSESDSNSFNIKLRAGMNGVFQDLPVEDFFA